MIKYILYARKSSEDKKRQFHSIKDQKKAMTRIAKSMNIEIVDIIEENKSAKSPGRQGFSKMIERIHNGDANGIMCWKPDRLARNPVDGGQIIWLLQNNIIKHIQTATNSYLPTDSILPLSLEFGMSNQYVLDLKVNTQRGTSEKAQRGWYPASQLPMGYKHNPEYLEGNSIIEIIPDSKTFKIMKHLWKMQLTGLYNMADIKREADTRGLVNRMGNPYALNSFHKAFRNPFYMGKFYWRNENGEKTEFKGKHKPIVTEKQFMKVQRLLGENGNPTRLRKYLFPYRGLISCGECQGYVSAQDVYQVICTHCKTKFSAKTKTACKKCGLEIAKMKNPSRVMKRYYHCRKKTNKECTQKTIEESEVEKMVLENIREFGLDSEFAQWTLNELERLEIEGLKTSDGLDDLKKEERALKKELINYRRMRANQEITAEEYIEDTEERKKRLKDLSLTIQLEEDKVTDWKSKSKQRVQLLSITTESFLKRSEKDKKFLIKHFGANLTLKDKSLSITMPFWAKYLKSREESYMAKMSRGKPKNHLVKQGDLSGFIPLNPIWLCKD